jgi:hypothetical protein
VSSTNLNLTDPTDVGFILLHPVIIAPIEQSTTIFRTAKAATSPKPPIIYSAAIDVEPPTSLIYSQGKDSLPALQSGEKVIIVPLRSS